MQVFNINKPFPYKEDRVLVDLGQDFVVYGYRGLEHKLFSDDLDFLTRFKKMRYDGGIISSQDLFRVRFPKHTKALIEHGKSTLFITKAKEGSLVELDAHFFNRENYESLSRVPVSSTIQKKMEEARKINGVEEFAKFIDGYKVDNIFNTKIMQVYNSNYFNNYFYSSNSEIKDLDIESAINEDMDNRNSYEYYAIE